ncbi:MAG TPA: hypothetical protein VMZ06_13610 [Candidatus Bathyarchaeia archaeon]|nr:hypothetical protein [Candidatus Bathyarchaeia archaeon]
MNKRAKTVLKIAAPIAVAGVAAVLLYALLFGPLFAFSPLKFGFNELHLGRCKVSYPSGATPDPAYSQLDDLMAETEKFHRLSFKKNVLVIVCASNSQYRRFSLASGNACTVQTGTVIYIRPSISEAAYPPRIAHQGGVLKLLPPANPAKRDLASFLKHELSHAVLYQNTTLWKAMKIKRWPEEGLAVYFGNTHHYYAGEDLRSLAIDDGFWFNLTNEDAEPVGIPDGIKHFFSYGAYCGFITYLVDTYGRHHVLNFVKDYIRSPQNEEALFKKQFGISLNDALEEFRKRLTSIR